MNVKNLHSFSNSVKQSRAMGGRPHCGLEANNIPFMPNSPTVCAAGSSSDCCRRYYKAAAAAALLLFLSVAAITCFLCVPVSAQTPMAAPTAVRPQEGMTEPKAIQAEYGKLDKLVSFLRGRNAEQFAVSSAKGVDDASYVSIGGISQWVTIRGEDRANPLSCSCMGGPVM